MSFFGNLSSPIDAIGKNTLEETNKNNNIKNVKFEILVDDLAKNFGKLYISNMINPLELIFDLDEVNKFAQYIILNGIIETADYLSIYALAINNVNNEGIEGIKEFVIECKRNPQAKFRFIFWSLFIVSVDENQYKDKLNIIADIAYLAGFTEEMLKDWITALKLILEGKDFKNYIYSSKEANQFFGHR